MEWRRLERFPDYAVSECGDVLRVRSAPPSLAGRLLRGRIDAAGRRRFKMRDASGTPVHIHSHSLVAAAFLGPRPRGMFCCHRDGDPANNDRRNLYYGTQKENMADRDRHGRTPRGERNGRAKLTAQQVSTIRARRAAGEQSNRLAAEFGVSPQLVAMITLGQCWRSVGEAAA